ncbi:MAG: histidine phosphatase family protein [Burkholderiales bacterium]|nr:histidine phosphatase family protein [Burkholderiales bacterium]
MIRPLTTIAFLLLAFASAAGEAASGDEQNTALWTALKDGGHVILLRHAATEPGIGDPPGYKLDDCKTQRNLRDAGREQSRAWGKAFAQIPVGGVFSSVWCRCVETAKLAFSKAETWPALNSHFDSPQSATIQAEQLKGGIPVRMQKGKNLVLVTHQVNITQLSGWSPNMGEAVVMRVSGTALQPVGRLQVPDTGTQPRR